MQAPGERMGTRFWNSQLVSAHPFYSCSTAKCEMATIFIDQSRFSSFDLRSVSRRRPPIVTRAGLVEPMPVVSCCTPRLFPLSVTFPSILSPRTIFFFHINTDQIRRVHPRGRLGDRRQGEPRAHQGDRRQRVGAAVPAGPLRHPPNRVRDPQRGNTDVRGPCRVRQVSRPFPSSREGGFFHLPGKGFAHLCRTSETFLPATHRMLFFDFSKERAVGALKGYPDTCLP